MGMEKSVENMHFTVLTSFDRRSTDRRTNRVHQNHESSVDEAEVLRLAIEGVRLLKLQPTSIVSKDKLLHAAYQDLHSGRSSFISVLKGIHQISSKPHLTARIVGKATLHIWLSQSEHLMEGPMRGKYIYKAVAVSATPPTDDRPGGYLVPACTVVGIPRRNSISLEVLERERLRLEMQQLEMQRREARAELEDFLYGDAGL